MSKSKKGSSPLQSLVSQWSQQLTAKSYNILLQHATGLVERTQAADAVANLHLYRRAKVRTPAENATRDILGGYLWLQHLLELVVALPDVHVIYIPTTTTTLTTTMTSSPNLTILPTATDPWGWEDDDESSSSSVNFNDISSLAKVLQDVMDKNTLSEKKTVIVWESLTPLLARHGGLIYKTISFLRQFSSSSSCLQIWPVRIDSVTKVQHAHLEDTASAVLWLQGGDMTLIRQGIRETGNIVREILPFRIEAAASSSSQSNGMYRFLLDENEEENQDETPQDQETANFSTSNTRTPAKSTDETSAGTVKTRSRTKIQLQIEEEKVEAPPEPTENRPRIFLQDDDPEFDDLDEEDPDDDLEI
jgi:hypothetical protein